MYTNQKKCQELASSSSFYSKIYSEVEEIGWRHLVRLGEDLTSLSFRIIDKKGRTHTIMIELDKAYPKSPPSISADVPCIFDLQWSANSTLKDVVKQFRQHLDKLQPFWSTMDEIDGSLRVFDPKHPQLATSYRQIDIGNDCYIILSIDPDDPKALPEFRGEHTAWNVEEKLPKMVYKFIHNSILVSEYHLFHVCYPSTGIGLLNRIKDKPFAENLVNLLKIQLPGPPDEQKSEQQSECGICYAPYLPIDDELGTKSGSGTDYTCENNNCSKAFHSICLADWLRSITTRHSFDVLFGNCPYCSDPIAVKINTKK
nr:E3 ubiquitin-protein ligase FANCL isoform X1 [Ipomoea batatas]